MAEPSKVLPVLPMVKVVAVANLVAVAALPDIEALLVIYPLSLVNEDTFVGLFVISVHKWVCEAAAAYDVKLEESNTVLHDCHVPLILPLIAI